MPLSHITFHRPDFGMEELQLVEEVLKSGWVTSGPKVREFEEAIKDYVNCPCTVALNSCTAAMHVALAGWGVGPGDEVITTPFTFCATVEAIEYVGATPVLADIDPLTGNIDPECVREKLSERTKVIIPVHYAGLPCELGKLGDIAKANNLKILEDAALALGSSLNGRRIGAHSDAVAFSFYATKNLSTGEGGMLACQDEAFADKCRRLSLHGMNRDAWKRYGAGGKWYYEICELGFKYNLTDIAAAMGIAQLGKLERANDRRREIAAAYIAAFRKIPFINPFQWDLSNEVVHNRHLFPLVLKLDALSIDRERFIEQLGEAGIGTSVHYIPIYRHPYYRDRYNFDSGEYPNTESIYSAVISLPIYPALDDEDVQRVIEAVKRIGFMHQK